jgi:hypothetical protein
VSSLALAVITLATALATFDRETHRSLETAWHAAHGRWDQVLAIARQTPRQRFPQLLSYAVNRALQAQGRLGDEMFRYPQTHFSLMTRSDPRAPGNRGTLWMRCAGYFQLGDLLYELGLLNDAEHEAHEALEMWGDHGEPLIRLAKINILKGQTSAARVFLNVAARDPVWAPRARELLRALARDPRLGSDPELERVRARALLADSAELVDFPTSLRMLLARNPRNRMAFDYLMASLLLSRRPDLAVLELPRLDAFGAEPLPRHYQEAVVLVEAIARHRVDLRARTVDPAVRQSFEEFIKLLGCDRDELLVMALRPLPPAVVAALHERQSDTYFHYFYCRHGDMP